MIQVSYAEYVEVVEKNIINISLVGSEAIGQVIGKNFTFIGSISCPKVSVFFGLRVYSDSMKYLTNIELRIDLSSSEPGKYLVDERQGLEIFAR